MALDIRVNLKISHGFTWWVKVNFLALKLKSWSGIYWYVKKFSNDSTFCSKIVNVLSRLKSGTFCWYHCFVLRFFRFPC